MNRLAKAPATSSSLRSTRPSLITPKRQVSSSFKWSAIILATLFAPRAIIGILDARERAIYNPENRLDNDYLSRLEKTRERARLETGARPSGRSIAKPLKVYEGQN
ncbi:hypothetical protein PROFUN_05993 [Planoprotostelium fungivorum]|uniref:Uncharacterized protein n=1 Tax=Planoprotostelium fungivorum TaxID=1890364 RepID=A0A2P6NPC0_9EUKA|nr:hypothetical protein PROFUN_05993 [Planoprotostelium fungivorum]